MLFPKLKMTAETLLSDFPEIHQSVFQAGISAGAEKATSASAEQIAALTAKVENLTAEKNEVERVEKITAYATKVGGSSEALQHCIENKLTFSDSLVYLVDNKKTEEVAHQDAVTQSAAALFNPAVQTVASSQGSDNDNKAPDTLVDAMKMVAKRDGCTLEVARKTAAVEFPGLFAKMSGLTMSDEAPVAGDEPEPTE